MLILIFEGCGHHILKHVLTLKKDNIESNYLMLFISML